MNLALIFLALQAIVAPSVKVSWDPQPDAQKYLLYRAPVVTTITVNSDGVPIPNDACGAWRMLGNTVGTSSVDRNQLTPGAWCYGVRAVHVEGGVDAVTGLPIAPITSVGELSNVAIVFIE